MNETNPNPLFKKIMVIDDNEIDLYIAETCIRYSSFTSEIILEQSAEKALAYLLSLQETPDELPDLIFLDIRMPVMDGFGFLEEYAKLPELISKNPIIMLSSSLNEEDHSRVAKNTFVDRFITKPLSKEKLQEIQFNEGKLFKSSKI